MNPDRYTHIFFVGAGGIGMSALARYFVWLGRKVAGYDRTPSPITDRLLQEGMPVLFEDNPELLENAFKNPGKTLVIFTPAVSSSNSFLSYFRKSGFTMVKRAEMLGIITGEYKTIAVAGTHGKTTVSTMIAHLLKSSGKKSVAILGGIAKNYRSNFIASGEAEFAVTEADEYDRSFFKLKPYFSVITSADADHLDIYGSYGELLEAFSEFATQTNPEGLLLFKKGIAINRQKIMNQNIFTYHVSDKSADVYAENIRSAEGKVTFDLITPGGSTENLQMQVAGRMNVENAVAASFIALKSGVTAEELKTGLNTFGGVWRRFDIRINTPKMVYVDDYAHHPEEIRALVEAVRATWPGRSITGIFQPHLYSRTRDLAEEFAKALDLLDEVILLDVYPAREDPLPGINSELILNKIRNQNKTLVSKKQLLAILSGKSPGILLTIGAGDIDRLVEPIEKILQEKFKKEGQS